MAKGDIITGRIAAAGNFQPAAGVEIMITALTNIANANTEWGLQLGTDRDCFLTIPPSSVTYNPPTLHKVGITNAGYLYTHQGGSYSGVQVK